MKRLRRLWQEIDDAIYRFRQGPFNARPRTWNGHFLFYAPSDRTAVDVLLAYTCLPGAEQSSADATGWSE